MPETKQLLGRAARSAPHVDYDLDAIRDRMTRRRRLERARAAIVALAVTILVAAAAFSVARAPEATDVADGPTGDEDALPPATTAPLVAAAGEYYYRAVLFVSACGDTCGVNDLALDATTWWSPSDDSGRIAVDAAEGYGMEAGWFGPGEFPNANGIDVSDFPHDPDALLRFLLERSDRDGASPAPVVTPPPGGAPSDGQLWRAITDLLEDPHTTPIVRAALLEAAARLQGSSLATDIEDPFGRPAHVVEFGNQGGSIVERLYVDPASHDLLTWTFTAEGEASPSLYYVVQDAGIASSVETAIQPGAGSVPSTTLSVDDLRALGVGTTSEAATTPGCSQGGPDLTLTRSAAGYDHDCFVVEAGVPFTITFRIEDDRDGALSIHAAVDRTMIFEGDRLDGPGEITYDLPAIAWAEGGVNGYVVRDGDVVVGTLYVR